MTAEVARMIDSASNKVGHLGRFHSKQAVDFKLRIKAARDSVVQQGGISFVTTPASSPQVPPTEKPSELPPW